MTAIIPVVKRQDQVPVIASIHSVRTVMIYGGSTVIADYTDKALSIYLAAGHVPPHQVRGMASNRPAPGTLVAWSDFTQGGFVRFGSTDVLDHEAVAEGIRQLYSGEPHRSARAAYRAIYQGLRSAG